MDCFGDKLERLIELENINQSEVAKRSELTGAAISKLLNDKERDPMWSTCLKIMKAFPHVPLGFWFNEATYKNGKLAQDISKLSDDAWMLNDSVRNTLKKAAHALVN